MRNSIFFIVISCLLPTFSALADEIAGQIVKTAGNVLVFRGEAVRGETVNQTARIEIGDRVQTRKNSNAFIKFQDGSKVVLLDDSTLFVKAIDHSNVDSGKILFEIKKRGQAKGLQVTTDTVTMGVRGTRFAVTNTDKKVSIYLKEGELEIASQKGDFKRVHQALQEEFAALQKKMQEEFEATRNQMKKDFEDSKRQMVQGNVEYIREFIMKSGSAVNIDDNEVKDTEIPPFIDDSFMLLDTF